jgi:alpha-tubulin suppressor-like RCC1 family protein
MALNGSGPISLAGTTEGESIAVELGESATGTIALNDTIVRDLAEVSSGAITMPTDFYGKASAFEGSLYGWGLNDQQGLGIPGDTTARSSPVQITTATNWSVIHASNEHTAGVRTDGTLWTWGSGQSGRGGRNSTSTASSPTQIGALTNWAYVDTGEGMCAALKTDGTLWTWGGYFNGRLGTNDDVSRSSPVQVGSDTDWAVLVAGNAVLAVKTDGTLWSWGRYTTNGQGVGNIDGNRSSPTQIGSDTDWANVGGSEQNDSAAFAIKTSGEAYFWGGGDKGQRGDNSIDDYAYTPAQLGALTNWSKIKCGNQTSFAVKTDGTLWSWGLGESGVIGQTTTQSCSSPIQIGSLTSWDNVFPAYGNFAFAIKTDGTLWAWGNGDKGLLGDNQSAPPDHRVSSPVQIGAETGWGYIGGGSEEAWGIEGS